MRRLSLLFLLVLLFGCGTRGSLIKPGFEHFRIYIEQDGTVKDIDSGEVSLDKKPFVIIVTFIGPDSIFMNASFTDESYIPARDGKPAQEIYGFKGTGIAEELYNPAEVLMISKKSPNFWHYENESDHRFNEVTERSGILICKRRISNIVDLDSSKEKIYISEMEEDEIYLVFMKLEWNDNYDSKIEKKRDYLRLVFK